MSHSNAAKLFGMSNIELEAFVEKNDIDIFLSGNGRNYLQNTIDRFTKTLMSEDQILEASLLFDDEKYFFNKAVGLPSMKEIITAREIASVKNAAGVKKPKDKNLINTTKFFIQGRKNKPVRNVTIAGAPEDRGVFLQDLIDTLSSKCLLRTQ